jgi:dienelactone hydrolase
MDQQAHPPRARSWRLAALAFALAPVLTRAAAAQTWPTAPAEERVPVLIDAELAGRPLFAYPWFEFVRNFHEGTPLWVGRDVNRHLELIGATVDVYITADQDAAAWAANPTLTDVRGTPTPMSFVAGPTSNNWFGVDTGSLSGDGGTTVGVPYDIVLDVDRDGQLGPGDVIDGRTDAGAYVVRDTTLPGPLAVSKIVYSGGTWLGQETFYPSSIASMGQLPVVIISHGNGHNYQWYSHFGNHFASYGYVVMSHQNNTQPGVETASTTTLTNTDYLVNNLASIGGGVLNGHVDTSRITWIGHSRGGEGVVRAFNRVITGQYQPTGWSAGDIVLLSSIAPVTTLGTTASNPLAVPYFFLYGASDSDVTGSPSGSNSKPFALLERSIGPNSSVYIQGAGHAYFHNGNISPCWCTGPNGISRPTQHAITLGYYLPIVDYYARGNGAGLDFLERHYDTFRPKAVPASVVVSQQNRGGFTSQRFVIDDYQTQTGLAVSSSGGAVAMTVANAAEGRMVDQDGSFDFNGGVPHNGMTSARDPGDLEACVVFDFSPGGDAYYELEIVPAERDLSDDTWLSFRACQGTRHPETDALDAPLSFSVSLRDGAGVASRIGADQFGRLTRTYPRTGSGTGAGWANEWSTFRLRIADFERDCSGIDLTDIVAVRFDFGASFGSPRGRVGLDDVEIYEN